VATNRPSANWCGATTDAGESGALLRGECGERRRRAQDTWIAVLKGIEKFEGRSTFKTWLLRICVNRARTSGVKEHRSIP